MLGRTSSILPRPPWTNGLGSLFWWIERLSRNWRQLPWLKIRVFFHSLREDRTLAEFCVLQFHHETVRPCERISRSIQSGQWQGPSISEDWELPVHPRMRGRQKPSLLVHSGPERTIWSLRCDSRISDTDASYNRHSLSLFLARFCPRLCFHWRVLGIGRSQLLRREGFRLGRGCR